MISLSNFAFFMTEAVTNLRRSGMMAFITVMTIGIALIMMGAFLLVTMNMESFLEQMRAEAMVTAYMHKNVSITDAKTLSLRLTDMEEIENIDVVSPDQAAKELFSNPDDQKLLQIGVSEDFNPLPSTLRIRLRTGSNLQNLLTRLKEEPMIDNFSYGEDLFRQFEGLSHLLWISSLIIVLLLGLSSLFIVYNNVRLTLYMRREEIIIMKLVGATNWFTRGPFIVEGFIQGLIASIFAIIVLFSTYNFAMTKLAELIPFFSADIGVQQLFKLCTKLLMMGLLLGISGSLLSLRDISKFSKSSPEGI